MTKDHTPVRPSATQPFTFGGVARFAYASIGRLLLAALLFGCLAGLSVMWLGARGWAPAIDEAVEALPKAAAVEQGALIWPDRIGRLLGANRFLSIAVVLQDPSMESAAADVMIEAHLRSIIVRSLLGGVEVPYPSGMSVTLDKTSVAPGWGAWRAPILFLLIPVTALFLTVIWALLAIAYSFCATAIGGLLNRDLNFRRAWKLCVAAQLPGSLLMTFAIALYASGEVSVLFIVVMFAAHFIPTVLYILVSPMLAPKRLRPEDGKKNPFGDDEEGDMRARNPFAGSVE